MPDLSGFEEAATGYKVRKNAWVVRGFPRGEWVSEVREDDWFGSDKESALSHRDYWNSVGVSERPHNAIVVEYVLYEKVIHDTVKDKS